MDGWDGRSLCDHSSLHVLVWAHSMTVQGLVGEQKHTKSLGACSVTFVKENFKSSADLKSEEKYSTSHSGFFLLFLLITSSIVISI
jgi:hypothetical protein